MQHEITNNYPFLMQKKEKTEDFRPKGKDKTKLTDVPLTRNCMQTRRSKLEHINQEREKEIPNRCKRIRG